MSESYELKQCARCGTFIPTAATMCAQCGTSDVDGKRGAPAPPPRARPPASRVAVTFTMGILVVNILYFLWSLFVQKQLTPDLNPGAVLLLWAGDARGLAYAGWYDHGKVFGEGQYWRLLAATFLHGGGLHIGMNMYVWVQIGRFAEDLWGAARLAVIYVVSGLGSTLAISIWYVAVLGESNPPEMVGASGAIFGVLGALATFAWRLGTQRGRRFGTMLFRNILLMLAIGFIVPIVSNVGHVGGLLPGMAIGAVVGERFGDRLRPEDGRWNLLASLGLAACALALIQGFIHSAGMLGG